MGRVVQKVYIVKIGKSVQKVYMKLYKKCIWMRVGGAETWKRGNVETWKRGNVGGEVPIGARQVAHHFPVTVSVIQFYYLTFPLSAARICSSFPLLLLALALENYIV